MTQRVLTSNTAPPVPESKWAQTSPAPEILQAKLNPTKQAPVIEPRLAPRIDISPSHGEIEIRGGENLTIGYSPNANAGEYRDFFSIAHQREGRIWLTKVSVQCFDAGAVNPVSASVAGPACEILSGNRSDR